MINSTRYLASTIFLMYTSLKFLLTAGTFSKCHHVFTEFRLHVEFSISIRCFVQSWGVTASIKVAVNQDVPLIPNTGFYLVMILSNEHHALFNGFRIPFSRRDMSRFFQARRMFKTYVLRQTIPKLKNSKDIFKPDIFKT